jgi:hypothetical protein
MADIVHRDGKAEAADEAVPAALHWVKDAPLFIDDDNVERFYDAMVRPAFKEDTPLKLKLTAARKKELEGKLGAKGKFGLASWISTILGAAEVEASAEAKVSGSTSNTDEQEITLSPISTPQRKLVQLVVYYLLNQPKRLLAGNIDAPLVWQRDSESAEVPRALVFLDLPPETKFVPMAAEFENGKVTTLFAELRGSAKEPPPQFVHEKKQEYWGWFAKNFDAGQCTDVIEKASGENGKIEWIDFRVPLNDKVDTMHLHFEARRRYFTGALAYMIVRRGVGHGLRLVGTLKDGPDINVLALYEK